MTRSLIAAVLLVASVGASQQVDVKATDPDGTTALHRAVHSEDLNRVQTLIRGGANVKASVGAPKLNAENRAPRPRAPPDQPRWRPLFPLLPPPYSLDSEA